jgi:hypothetical protein
MKGIGRSEREQNIKIIMWHSDGKNQFLHFLGLFYIFHIMSIFGIKVDGKKEVGDNIKSFMTNFKILAREIVYIDVDIQ